jgi:NADH:ubiquinone reductase (H+-translocating)
MVMIDWAWAYWTYERNARVVAEPAAVTAPPAGSH